MWHADLVNFAGKKAFVVFNAASPNATRLFAEVAPVIIAADAAYHHAIPKGRVASEIEPVSRAAADIELLWNWACHHVNMPSCRHENSKQRDAA